MKKFMSRVAILIGVAALVWAVYTVLHFGAVNMRRVEEANYQYRLHWADRK